MTDAEYQFELGRAYDKGYREAEALFMSMCSRDGVCGCHRWWHYPSKGEYPTEAGNYLIVYEVANALVRSIKFYNPIAKEFDITLPVIAWQYLPDLPPKEEA